MPHDMHPHKKCCKWCKTSPGNDIRTHQKLLDEIVTKNSREALGNMRPPPWIRLGSNLLRLEHRTFVDVLAPECRSFESFGLWDLAFMDRACPGKLRLDLIEIWRIRGPCSNPELFYPFWTTMVQIILWSKCLLWIQFFTFGQPSNILITIPWENKQTSSMVP